MGSAEGDADRPPDDDRAGPAEPGAQFGPGLDGSGRNGHATPTRSPWAAPAWDASAGAPLRGPDPGAVANPLPSEPSPTPFTGAGGQALSGTAVSASPPPHREEGAGNDPATGRELSGGRDLTAGGMATAAAPGAATPGGPTDPHAGVPQPAMQSGRYPVAPYGAFPEVAATRFPVGWPGARHRRVLPPARTHRWGLGAFLLVALVFIGTSLLVGWLAFDDAPPSAGALALALAVPTVLAAGAALLITKLRGNGPRIDLGLQWSWRDVGLGLAFGFGGLVITIPASILYVAIVGENTTSAVGNVFMGVRAGPLLALTVFVIVAFVAPLCEEIVYRGLLWGGVERLGAGPWVTLAVTTLLFALAHYEFERTPLLLIVALPVGLARVYTGRLLASIVAHQINNLLPGVALLLLLLGFDLGV